MKAPIVSRKHIVQHTVTQVVTGTVNTANEVSAVAVQDVNTAQEVVEGSVVKAIFIELWFLGTFSEGSFVMMVEKATGGQIGPTIANMTTLDAYPNKKNILFTSQGLLPEDNANPIPVMRQWLKIPKGKQRFGLLDKLRVNIAAIGPEDVQFCGVTIYKSYQ